MKSKTQAYFGLLLPSGIGAVLCGFGALLVIVLNQFPYIQRYLDLPANIEFTRFFAHKLDVLLTSTIGEARTNIVVVGLFWAVVGLAVYVFLQALSRFMMQIGEGFEEQRYVWPKGANRRQPIVQATELALFRLVAFIGLLFMVFQPLASLIKGVPFKDFIGPNLPLQYFIWFVSLFVVLHCCIVLLRLVSLKVRLFE